MNNMPSFFKSLPLTVRQTYIDKVLTDWPVLSQYPDLRYVIDDFDHAGRRISRLLSLEDLGYWRSTTPIQCGKHGANMLMETVRGERFPLSITLLIEVITEMNQYEESEALDKLVLRAKGPWT